MVKIMLDPSTPPEQRLIYQNLMEKVKLGDVLSHSSTLKIGGKPFRCDCLANVFTKIDSTWYMCNSCKSVYGCE